MLMIFSDETVTTMNKDIYEAVGLNNAVTSVHADITACVETAAKQIIREVVEKEYLPLIRERIEATLKEGSKELQQEVKKMFVSYLENSVDDMFSKDWY